mmetsp:Transcript_84068/g.270990  ORF Transcript_84068/g.270990 Transcript_84068/m.270990 type:complete len:493 (-) Transcript_84068:146-1624(-)
MMNVAPPAQALAVQVWQGPWLSRTRDSSLGFAGAWDAGSSGYSTGAGACAFGVAAAAAAALGSRSAARRGGCCKALADGLPSALRRQGLFPRRVAGSSFSAEAAGNPKPVAEPAPSGGVFGLLCVAAYLGTRFAYSSLRISLPSLGQAAGGLNLELCVVSAQVLIFGVAAAVEGLLRKNFKKSKIGQLSKRVLAGVVILDILRYSLLSLSSAASFGPALAPALLAAALAVAMALGAVTFRKREGRFAKALAVAVLCISGVGALGSGEAGAALVVVGAFAVTGLSLLGQEVLMRYGRVNVSYVALLTSVTQFSVFAALAIASSASPLLSPSALLALPPGALKAVGTYTAMCCLLRFTMLQAVKATSTVSVLSADLLFMAYSFAALSPNALGNPVAMVRLGLVAALCFIVLRKDANIAKTAAYNALRVLEMGGLASDLAKKLAEEERIKDAATAVSNKLLAAKEKSPFVGFRNIFGASGVSVSKADDESKPTMA